MITIIKYVLIMALVIYALLLLILWLFQAHLVYNPRRAINATPAIMDLSYESVEFHTTDGIVLHGWILPAERTRGWVLFFHGNGGNISHRIESLAIFAQLGLSAFSSLTIVVMDRAGAGRQRWAHIGTRMPPGHTSWKNAMWPRRELSCSGDPWEVPLPQSLLREKDQAHSSLSRPLHQSPGFVLPSTRSFPYDYWQGSAIRPVNM